MNKFRLNLEVDWEHCTIFLQDPPHGAIRWNIKLNKFNSFIGDNEMSITITDTQKFSFSIQPVDARGNPAEVDGVPEWNVSDPNVLSLSLAADGLSGEVAAVGPLGYCQLTVTADADLGEGFKLISGTLDVYVVGGEAVALQIVTGAPEEQ